MPDTPKDTLGGNADNIQPSFETTNRNVQESKSNFSTTTRLNKSKRFGLKKIVLSIGFVLLVIAGGMLAINLFRERESGTGNSQIKSVFSGEELKDYSSPENKFTILMPGLPVISKSKAKSGDKEIPITTYERLIENSSKNYTLAVYDYSGIALDEPKVLESALNNAIQNTPGAKLGPSKAGKYAGLNAIEATYNVTDKEKVYEAHIRYVIKDSKMYAMILIGSDQAKFDEFANSLRLS